MFLSFWISALTFLSSSYATSILTPERHLNSTQRRDGTAYVQAAYFPNWSIYPPVNFQPTDIDPSQLTHILYAFADVSPDTGVVFLSDPFADEEKLFPGDSSTQPGNNLYGCLKQLYLLKLANRHLKVLLSVGGGTYSNEGHFSFIVNDTLRASFVASAVQLIKDYGFDGMDIDFEYPESEDQNQGFLALMTSLRNAFDQLAIENGDNTPYELMTAVAGQWRNYLEDFPVQQLDPVLTYWNLMAYDYSGPWTTLADNQANLYGGNMSTDAAVSHYVSSGATVGKIVMGIPLYGRSFENTEGIGQPYDGVGPGTYPYNSLPLPGAEVFEDLADVASYSYDSTKKELVSYDDPDIVRIKAEYVQAHSLAGCMFWELASDKTGADSLVQTALLAFGQLEQTPNHIYYPNSKWDNIRNNMGTGSTTPATTSSLVTPVVTMTTTTLAPTSTTTPYSGMCEDVLPWNETIAYSGGDKVVYGDHLWTAKWWTEADVPGGAAGVWVDEGTCE